MLANRQFPAASFIRSAQQMDYLEEPDIFHEILGHAPLLSDPGYAGFVQAYGAVGRRAKPEDRIWLARLFWFTVEFGLIQTDAGVKAFGAGIVSSREELAYSVDDPGAERRAFDVIDILRTPYHIDILQPVYYVLESLEQLFEIAQLDLMPLIQKARTLGLETIHFNRRSA
jgi:phenylalanine-4-hydroxylase